MTSEEWLYIAKGYENRWNFPHCMGAMDGKHVTLQAPFKSGAEFFNYKSTFSIVLFALIDSNYNFLYVNAGCQGRISDGGVFKNCELNKKMENNLLEFPMPTPLPGRQKSISYFMIADEAFLLGVNIMQVYSGLHPKGSFKRNFNYRLCRARRVVENVFGILSAVFRVLRKPILLEPEKAEIIVMAIAHLHNFLRKSPNSINIYTPHGTFDEEIDGKLVEGTWRVENKGMTSLIPIRNVPRRSTLDAKEIRDEISDFFMNEGKIPWQNEYA